MAALLGLQLLLRLGLVFRFRVDTDEPQHLHVSWAWTQGLVPYRDVFDNHAPLFHLLMAPLVAAVGERPEILLIGRLSMVPLAVLSLWSLYSIGRDLFSVRVGIWAAALAGLVPAFFLTSIEYRADDLWSALWLAALAVAFRDPLEPRRTFAAGALLGATFATSMKTVLLAATLFAGLAVALAVHPRLRERLRDRRLWIALAAVVPGMLLVPIGVALHFAAMGAFDDLVDSVFAHNVAVTGLWNYRALRTAMLVVTLPMIVLTGRAVLRGSARRPLSRAALVMATLLYMTTLNGLWPVVTRQDYLPPYPLLALFFVAGLLPALENRSKARNAVLLLAALGTVEAALTVWYARPWKDGTKFAMGLARDALRLTSLHDTVMDLKGEMIFRRRAFFYALESVTLQRFRDGTLRDDIAERLASTHTYVSVVDSPRFPPEARRFLLENYVPVGHLRVAGKFLDADARGVSAFVVALDGSYVVLSREGRVPGMLDGTPLHSPRMLGAGPHTFVPEKPVGPLALVWANAADLGFSPFHPNVP